MHRFIKSAVLAVSVAATSFAALPAAHADDWNGRGWRHGGGWHRNNDGALIGAGVAGLALGALAGGLLSRPAPDYYYGDPVYEGPVYEGPVYQRRVYVQRPRVVYRTARPWTRGWYDYCSARYRTFDPQSGTYVGNDGREHFCSP